MGFQTDQLNDYGWRKCGVLKATKIRLSRVPWGQKSNEAEFDGHFRGFLLRASLDVI